MSIVIFGRELCDWCDRAQEICRQYDMDYEYKNLTDRFVGESYKAELRHLAETQDLTIKTVPQIWWNGKYIGGFNELAAEIENTRSYGDGKI